MWVPEAYDLPSVSGESTAHVLDSVRLTRRGTEPLSAVVTTV